MKHFGLSLVIVGLVLAVLPAQAQEQTTYTLLTHSEGGSGYFTIEGQTARNPTLSVPNGQTITLNIKAADGDGVHNICVGTICSDYVQAEGDTATMTFTSSASTSAYHCAPHKGAGMLGTISVAGASAGGEKKSPGTQVLGVAIAMIGAALFLARRK